MIVCGGRDFNNQKLVDDTLDSIDAETQIYAIIHGNARGADTLAGAWAKRNHRRCWPVPAQWKKFGKSAGPKRNQAMLGMGPDLVVAMPGGRGTADMVKRSQKAGVPVHQVNQ